MISVLCDSMNQAANYWSSVSQHPIPFWATPLSWWEH